MKRILLLLLISVGALFLLVTIISSFLPNHVRVSRAVTIQASPDSVRSILAQKTYWESVLPSGTLIIDEIRSDSTSHVMVKSKAAIQMAAGYQLLTGTIRTSCSVQRYYDFYFDWYPWEKFSSLMVESRFGVALENELQQLKGTLEK